MKKIMLVTGAANGTGYGIAQKFAKEGWDVCITSRDASRAQEAAQQLMQEFPGIQAFGYAYAKADENVAVSILDSLEEKGYQVEALVANAANQGIGHDLLNVSFEEWSAVIEANVFMHFILMREAARRMVKYGIQGAMVICGSNTMRRPLPQRSSYCTSKAALGTMAKAFAVDLGQYKIRVNYLAIGSIKTSRWDSLSEEVHQVRLARAPLKDLALFEDVANAVYFLCSDQARIITGAELYADAGVDAAFPCGSDNG